MLHLRNPRNHTETKVRASDGAVLGQFAVGNNGAPKGVAFDGTHIWVTNLFINSVSKLRASDEANLGSFARNNHAGQLQTIATSATFIASSKRAKFILSKPTES